VSAVSFTIPGDARGKGRPRATIRGRHAAVYTDAKTASYENLVKLAAAAAMRGSPPIAEPVELLVSVRVTPPKSASRKVRAEMLANVLRPAKKPDLTNIIKAVEDGANAVVYTDDSLIVSIVASKVYAETASVGVTVETIRFDGAGI
jgi:Holliday junction resolvase RusA-like endonuclease